ncbi:VOC family protein [Bizionia paragorgiae]|jgi:PhnB protein|uniref:PhnB protein n=1 Tax=Bizionia paragorgiae TaxID=283786 RepID=A0A1H4CRZ7_BIZPA|nr:VOC family protein [Bizionia paragorgiae]MDX1270404.1 VOC family protein [Bizionia paragorgiae]SEA63069.1 PhnB protein [Bizionia paragorgiae]
MATINTYLNFNGNCEKAFNFYKAIFGGEFTYLGYFKDMPESEDCKIDDEDKNKIMHVSLPIGHSILMGSDTAGQQQDQFNQGNNFSISITADSKLEADTMFQKLSVDGHKIMPLEDTFWGDYFGMLVDKFGIQWMISYNKNSIK